MEISSDPAMEDELKSQQMSQQPGGQQIDPTTGLPVPTGPGGTPQHPVAAAAAKELTGGPGGPTGAKKPAAKPSGSAKKKPE